MVIAVTTWLPLSTPNLPSSSPIPFSLGLRASTTTRRNPGILMAVSVPNSLRHIEEAPEKTNPIYPVRLFEAGFFHFFKYHGLGNDFIMIDNRDSMDLKVLPDEAVKLCERRFGVGADRVVFIMPGTDDTDFSMRILNSDGSEQEMCDNALRCLVKLLADLETRKGFHRYRIQTGAALRIAEVIFDGKVRVDMGKPVLKASDVPTELPANEDGSVVKAELDVDGVTWNVTCVSMGNPHCVTFGTKGGESLEVDELNLAEIGPKFEHHNVFPARTNTVFVQVLSRKHLKVRVWEHGAGATLACGTGACAAVVAAVLEGHVDRKCTVDLPGGPLLIEWVKKDSRLFMIGPAEAVFSASVPLWK